MKFFLAAVFSLFGCAQVQAQIVITPDQIRLGVTMLSMMHKYAVNKTASNERNELVEDIDQNLSELLEVARQSQSSLDRIEDLVLYENLRRRAKANRLRLASYTDECHEVSSACKTELSNLLDSNRSVSAEARSLEIGPISSGLVLLAQESELLLADVVHDDQWLALVGKDYSSYWQGALDKRKSGSLTSRLDKLEDQQAESIRNVFGAAYPKKGVATEEEFHKFSEWANRDRVAQIRLPGRLGCMIFDKTLWGGLSNSFGEVDEISLGEPIIRYESKLIAIVHDDGTSHTNSEVVQSPDLTTFEFRSVMNKVELPYAEPYSMENKRPFRKSERCLKYRGDVQMFETTVWADLKAYLEPIEVDINAPVAEMLILRNSIELAKAAKARII
ncbi:hypothetical protein [Hyphomonas sp.]|uniref:hypothetical protein n=1 Tax=Hyphomonas sp. TaxID=87 RepID=UPI00356788A5